MYEFNGILTDDIKGSFTGVSPAINKVGTAIEVLYKNAKKLELIYNSLITPCDSDSDIYIMYADIEEILDDIDMDELKSVCESYAIGTIGSKSEHWIIGPLLSLVGGVSAGKSSSEKEIGILDDLRKIIDECDTENTDKLKIISLNVYTVISAIYREIFNTYDLFDWCKIGDGGKSITRGFNEFLTRVNMSPSEIADEIYWKTMDDENTGTKFVFVTNEVDRDPEKGKRIREMVHASLRDRFEGIIEYITSEQVDDILNGKIKITESFIIKMENDDDVVAMDSEE